MDKILNLVVGVWMPVWRGGVISFELIEALAQSLVEFRGDCIIRLRNRCICIQSGYNARLLKVLGFTAEFLDTLWLLVTFKNIPHEANIHCQMK